MGFSHILAGPVPNPPISVCPSVSSQRGVLRKNTHIPPASILGCFSELYTAHFRGRMYTVCCRHDDRVRQRSSFEAGVESHTTHFEKFCLKEALGV